MATEVGLTTINVFNSQSDFDSHASEIGNDELSLVKIENLEIPGYVKSRGCKLLPFEFNNLTLLYDNNVTSGDITLSQPYTNFDGMLFEIIVDGNNRFYYQFISTWELSQAKARYLENKTLRYYEIARCTWYWNFDLAELTPTLLPVGQENSRIGRIYGVTV